MKGKKVCIKTKSTGSLASAQRPVKMGFNRKFILTSNDLAVTVYLLSFFPLENGYWRQWISRKCVFFAIHNLSQDHWAISGSDRLFTLFVLLSFAYLCGSRHNTICYFRLIFSDRSHPEIPWNSMAVPWICPKRSKASLLSLLLYVFWTRTECQVF